nr:hypothetical protein [Tanacetum cinerariifolium]
SLETSFSEYRQTNPFADAVSAIPDIVREDGKMMIRKDPPLDQTGGLKDKKKEETTFIGSCLEYNSASCSKRCSIMDKRSRKAN